MDINYLIVYKKRKVGFEDAVKPSVKTIHKLIEINPKTKEWLVEWHDKTRTWEKFDMIKDSVVFQAFAEKQMLKQQNPPNMSYIS